MNAQINEFHVDNKTYKATQPVVSGKCTGCDLLVKKNCIAPMELNCRGVILKEKKVKKKCPVFYTALFSVAGMLLFTYGIFQLIKLITNLIK